MGEVSWGEATWVSSIILAVIITAVGIAFFSIIILTSIRFHTPFRTVFVRCLIGIFAVSTG